MVWPDFIILTISVIHEKNARELKKITLVDFFQNL